MNKINFQNLPSTTTPVNASNLNLLQTNIESAINATEIELQSAIDKVDNISSYSTTETIIGKWINDKPLYRKVISLGSYTWNTGTHTFLHNISNLGSVTRLDLFGKYNSRWYMNWDMWISGNWVVDNTNIEITCSSTGNNFLENYIIIEYTKTTD